MFIETVFKTTFGLSDVLKIAFINCIQSLIKFLCILFLTLKYNINIIHMGVTLAELRLLGKNT